MTPPGAWRVRVRLRAGWGAWRVATTALMLAGLAWGSTRPHGQVAAQIADAMRDIAPPAA